MNPSTVVLPHDSKMLISADLVLPVSVASKFDKDLLQRHVMEAIQFVSECKQENKKALDVCGDRGDLYFLLRACQTQEFC